LTLTQNSTLTQNLTLTQIDFADKGFIIKTLFLWAFLVPSCYLHSTDASASNKTSNRNRQFI